MEEAGGPSRGRKQPEPREGAGAGGSPMPPEAGCARSWGPLQARLGNALHPGRSTLPVKALERGRGFTPEEGELRGGETTEKVTAMPGQEMVVVGWRVTSGWSRGHTTHPCPPPPPPLRCPLSDLGWVPPDAVGFASALCLRGRSWWMPSRRAPGIAVRRVWLGVQAEGPTVGGGVDPRGGALSAASDFHRGSV